jgi:hypothetical protein
LNRIDAEEIITTSASARERMAGIGGRGGRMIGRVGLGILDEAIVGVEAVRGEKRVGKLRGMLGKPLKAVLRAAVAQLTKKQRCTNRSIHY